MYQDITISSISHKSNYHATGQMEHKLFVCAWFLLPRIFFYKGETSEDLLGKISFCFALLIHSL